MSIAIIANPLAGRGRGKRTAQLAQELLTEKKADFEILYTQHEGQAVELAERAAERHRVVAALGGDGTIREVLAGTWQKQVTVGVIPGGTGNDYARGLGIPRETPAAVEVLLNGQPAAMDLGLEQDQIFGQLACIGFPVDVILHVNAHRDGLFKGSAAFLAGVVATISHLRTYPVRITIDGKAMERNVVGIFVMNMPFGGGGMMFAPQARFDDELFHLLVIERVSKLDLALTLPKIYSGNHLSHPAVSLLTGKDVRIEGDPLPIMLDGDIFPARPIHAQIMPQAAQVLIPKNPS